MSLSNYKMCIACFVYCSCKVMKYPYNNFKLIYVLMVACDRARTIMLRYLVGVRIS